MDDREKEAGDRITEPTRVTGEYLEEIAMHETRYPDDSRHPREGTNAIPKNPRAAKPAITEKSVRVFPRTIARLTLALQGGES